MKRFHFLLLFLSISYSSLWSQYEFKEQKTINCTEIKNQARTGTCWSFATASFIESELIQSGHKDLDLSEMFVVRNIYEDKAKNYILRQGKANFSQGSLSHDLIRIMSKNGVVPDEAYSGLLEEAKSHNHGEMEAGLKGFLDGILKRKSLSKKWSIAFNKILDVYLGEKPQRFNYKGKSYTPESFASHLGLDAQNYVSLSSFTHHPFYEEFILEIPDNYSNGSFYNVPIEEMMSTIDNALEMGYSLAWDGDVSEKGFSAKEGIAVLPEDAAREDLFSTLGKEKEVTQQSRQDAFESYSTTDDHLMHLIGWAKDQNGNKYYIIKNSWGEISPFKGYLYMSEAYVKMKTVAIMVNKSSIPKRTSSKLFAEK